MNLSFYALRVFPILRVKDPVNYLLSVIFTIASSFLIALLALPINRPIKNFASISLTFSILIALAAFAIKTKIDL